jgi:hypothetical protein
MAGPGGLLDDRPDRNALAVGQKSSGDAEFPFNVDVGISENC